MDNARAIEVLLDIQRGLPRQGPGQDDSTRRALSYCSALPRHPCVLDIGCGPGKQTLVLAEALGGSIAALDLHREFLDELGNRAEASGLRDHIHPVAGDMADLPFVPGRFDLLWSEGAAYIMGVERALHAWKRLLEPKGYLALSELVWLTDRPPRPAREFFEREYPAMSSVERNAALFAEAGYQLIGHFTLADDSWWDDYYTPLKKKLPELLHRYRKDEQALELVQMTATEIAVRESHGSSYGYEFFIARVDGD